jgi:hypothetical protein
MSANNAIAEVVGSRAICACLGQSFGLEFAIVMYDLSTSFSFASA